MARGLELVLNGHFDDVRDVCPDRARIWHRPQAGLLLNFRLVRVHYRLVPA